MFPVNISFIEKGTGDKINVDTCPGKSLLDVAIEYDVDIEGILNFCLFVLYYVVLLCRGMWW